MTPGGSPTALVFRWVDGKPDENYGSFNLRGKSGVPLSNVLNGVLGIRTQMIEGDAELLKTAITGDWVVRNETPTEQKVKELAAILQDELHLPIRVEMREVQRPVYVVTGSYQHRPYPLDVRPPKLDDATPAADRIDFFGTKMIADRPGSGPRYYPKVPFDVFLGALGQWIRKPIVSEVTQPPTGLLELHYHNHPLATDDAEKLDHDPELVLTNIADQTGLEFDKQDRKITLLFVEPASQPKAQESR